MIWYVIFLSVLGVVWTSHEPKIKFSVLEMHFRSSWTYLAWLDKFEGLPCILLFFKRDMHVRRQTWYIY